MSNTEVRIRLAIDGAGQVQAGVNGAAQSLDKLGQAQANVAKQTQLSGNQTAQLSAQLQDLFIQIQGGQAPLTALLQQGSQLSAVFGGTGNALRAVGSLVTPVAAGVGVLAASVGALMAGYANGAAEADGYRRALVLTGNAAGVTAAELQRLAAEQDAQAGTQAQAADVLTQLAASGRVARDVLAGAADAAIRLERAGGPAAEETAKKLAQLGKEPLQALQKLDEAEGFLTASLYKRVKALQDSGQATEAARVAQEGYLQAMSGRASELEQGLGSIERGWRSVKDVAKEAWDAMLGIGRPKDPMEEALKALEVAEQAASSIYRNERDQQRLTAAQEAVRLLQKERDLKASNAKADADALAEERRMTQLLETNAGWLGKQARLKKELADAQREGQERVSKGLITEAELQEKLTKIRESYRDKSADGKAERELEAQKKLIAELGGLTGDFAKEWDTLLKLFNSGKFRSVEELEEAQRRLLERQPAIRENYRAELEVAKETASARAALRRAEEAAIDQEFERRRRESESVASGLRDRIEALTQENAAVALSRSQQISLSQAIGQVSIKRLEDKAAALDAGSEAYAAVQRELDLRRQLAQQMGIAELNDFLDPSKAEDFGSALTKAFDGAGNSLAKMVNLLGQAAQKQKGFTKESNFINDTLEGQEKLAALTRLQNKVQRESLDLYAGMASAAKGFFKEGTTGYKALEAAETAFRVYQLASDLQKGLSAAAVAIARQGTGGDVYTAIPRMAAMAAIMAGLGFAVGGAFGGGATTGGDGAREATGTGSVLGDRDAMSESIRRSIDALADTADLQLQTQSGMLASLRSIESQIGGITNQVLRSGLVGGDVAERFGIRTGTGLTAWDSFGKRALGIVDDWTAGLFTRLMGKTTKITGTGLFAGPQDLGSIVSGGFSLQDFADINTSRKFLGIKVSNKNSTQYQDADPALQRQFGQIFASFYDALSLAAGPVGLALDDVKSKLDNFVVDIGKIDLQGLTGEQIQEKLSAVLGAAADKLAETAIPGLEAFQRVGEGYFETTVRVAAGIEQAEAALDVLGIGAIRFADVARKQGDVGAEIVRQSLVAFETLGGTVSSVGRLLQGLDGSADDIAETYTALVDVRFALRAVGEDSSVLSEALLRGAGGLGKLQDSLDAYLSGFFTEEEQVAARLSRLGEQFGRLGLQLPTDAQGFRALVESIDGSTAAGQKLKGQVLAMAEAFDDAAGRASALQDRLGDAIDAALPKFLSQMEMQSLQYRKVAADLAKAGVPIALESLLSATKAEIFDFASSFVQLEDNSIEARIAVARAAGTLADLKNAAADFVQVGDQRIDRSKFQAAVDAVTPGDFENAIQSYSGSDRDRAQLNFQVGSSTFIGALANSIAMQRLSPPPTNREVPSSVGADAGFSPQSALADAQRDNTDALKRLTQTLEEELQSLLVGDLSPLSAEDQLKAARANFDRLSAAADAGDLEAANQVGGAAREVLQLAQRFSPSQYPGVFDEIFAGIKELVSAAKAGNLISLNGLTAVERAAQETAKATHSAADQRSLRAQAAVGLEL